MNQRTFTEANGIDPAIEAAVDHLLKNSTLEDVWAQIRELVDQKKPYVLPTAENARFFLTLLAIEDRAGRGNVFFTAVANERHLLRDFLLAVGVPPTGLKGTWVSWPLRGALKAMDSALCNRLLDLHHRPSVVRRLLKEQEKDLLEEILEARATAARMQALLPKGRAAIRQRL